MWMNKTLLYGADILLSIFAIYLFFHILTYSLFGKRKSYYL